MAKARPRALKNLSPESLELIAERFRLLGETSRLLLLKELFERELSVGELVARSGLTQANVSRHLQQLTAAGITARRREGTTIYYSIGDPAVFSLCSLVCGNLRERFSRGKALLS